MSENTFVIERTPDVRLYARQWLPAGRPVGTVQIVTGMAEFLDRYGHVARAFCEAGYAVFGHDHRGQGNTASSPDKLGALGTGDWRRLVDDMFALHQRIAEAHPEGPHFIFGHSMGSFLTQTFLYSHPHAKQGAVLQGTESGRFWFWPLMLPISGLGGRVRGVDARSRFVPGLQALLFNAKYKNKRTRFDWLNTDPAVVDAYLADPRCGWNATHGFWREMATGMLDNGRVANLRRIPHELPMLLLAGTMDPTADYGRGIERLAKLLRKAGLSRIETRLYEGMRHELHNEPDGNRVLTDIVAWMERQRAAEAGTQAGAA